MRGQPPYKPNDQQRQDVIYLASLGYKPTAIARMIINKRTNKPIDKKTLEKHYSYEIEVGKQRVDFEVGKTIIEAAKSGESLQASIWYSKARMGWSENIDHEVKGNVNVQVIADFGQNEKKSIEDKTKVIDVERIEY
tara:strand:- start:170 stop:580 length:411 start_codon:yes stop_codon:yes gene_type:complete